MSLPTDFRRLIVDGGNTTATIPAGQTTSSIFNTSGTQIRGLYLPSNWTSCNITFLTSKLPSFSPFYLKTNVDGSPLSIATVANQDLPLLAYLIDYNTFVKIVCSTNQVQSVTVDFAMAPIYHEIT